MFLQISCNTSHSCCRFTGALFTFSFSMYLHTCSMMFMTGLWAGQFKTVNLLFRFLFSWYFLITLAVCLGWLSCWKTLPISCYQYGPFHREQSGGIWVMKGYRCPTPLNVIESQTCRDRPPRPPPLPTLHSWFCTYLLFGVAHTASNRSKKFKLFLICEHNFSSLHRRPCFVSLGPY